MLGSSKILNPVNTCNPKQSRVHPTCIDIVTQVFSPDYIPNGTFSLHLKI
jgi:hypothetical protein